MVQEEKMCDSTKCFHWLENLTVRCLMNIIVSANESKKTNSKKRVYEKKKNIYCDFFIIYVGLFCECIEAISINGKVVIMCMCVHSIWTLKRAKQKKKSFKIIAQHCKTLFLLTRKRVRESEKSKHCQTESHGANLNMNN